MQTAPEFYQTSLTAQKEEKKALDKKNDFFSLLRLLVFGVFLIVFLLACSLSFWSALGVSLLFIPGFRLLLKKHAALQFRIRYLAVLIDLNEKEIAALHGVDTGFDNGAEFSDVKHPYSSDLDVFGAHSLFGFLNRTSSRKGAETLAGWLRQAASPSSIRERQKAALELSGLTGWRQNFLIRGRLHSKQGKDLETRDLDQFYSWLKMKPAFSTSGFLKAILYLLPLITLAAAIYICFDFHPGILALPLLIQGLVVRLYSKKAKILHEQITRFSAIILSYSDLIACVENQEFTSQRLGFLRGQITRTSNQKKKASASLKALARLLANFDIRQIPIFHFLLNILFFWDIHQMMGLQNWKKNNQDHIPTWFDSISEFEALSSFGTCLYNQPHWSFPELLPDYFQLEEYEAAHPLILREEAIRNSLQIDSSGKVILITGSNMSGKSTFLRTIGLNAVLAMAGAPVCAEKFSISACQIYTSLRISDSLNERMSSFYAELKRLETLIELSKQGKPVFFLLDEILRGTNSNDRYIGSKALIKQFIKDGTSGILASHDLALSELDQNTSSLENYSFDVQVKGTELFFDYKLHPGKCTSLNASTLMKKIGIELSED